MKALYPTCLGVSVLIHSGILILCHSSSHELPKYALLQQTHFSEVELVSSTTAGKTIEQQKPVAAPETTIPEPLIQPELKLSAHTVLRKVQSIPTARPTRPPPRNPPSTSTKSKEILGQSDTTSPQTNTVADVENGATVQKAVTKAYPDYLSNPPPPYPEIARRRNHQGVVLLKVEVSELGTVTTVEVARSSGFDELDQSALNAVKKWKFRPGQIDGKAINSQVEVPVRFQLNPK